jgi:hypothetical protein
MEITNLSTCLLCVEGQPTKAVLAQTCMGVFFIHLLSDTIFAMHCLLKQPVYHLVYLPQTTV